MTTTRAIDVRRVNFDEVLTNLPKHYAGDGDLIMSHVLANLSAVFPEGEDFFVRSVRFYRDQIEDPDLRKAVGGFIGQEAIHGREHRDFNNRLDELGYGTKLVDRMTGKGLRFRERFAPPMSNLAATAALEHYTATLAETILASPEARAQIGAPGVQQLFMWHALEEAEHKAVAFDVYKAVGGTERMRRWTMTFTNVGFVGGMALQTAVSVLMDRSWWRNPMRLLRSIRRLRHSPFLTKEVVAQIRDYQRSDFHPDDRDTDQLLAEWREKLFGTEGELNDRLVRAS